MKKQQATLTNVCRHILGEIDTGKKGYVAPKEEPIKRLQRLLSIPGYAEAFARMPESKRIQVPTLEEAEPKASAALLKANAVRKHKEERAAMVRSRKEAKAAVLKHLEEKEG